MKRHDVLMRRPPSRNDGQVGRRAGEVDAQRATFAATPTTLRYGNPRARAA